MKDYKLLLAGLILLLLIIFIGIFMWLWNNNRKQIDPLPIMVSENTNTQSSTGLSDDPDAKDTITNDILYVQAEDKLQVPLDNVIIKFESRYPNVQVLARYVPTRALLTLPDSRGSDGKPSSFIVNIDVIIADDKITQTRLSPLQALIDNAQTKHNKSQVNANGMAQENTEAGNKTNSTRTDNSEARSLASFSYAIKDTQTVEGVILTDNPIAISFRNFLLSSAGQDVLKEYDYDNVDGYKNSMDDLFNPSSRAKTAAGEPSVEIADALSNAE